MKSKIITLFLLVTCGLTGISQPTFTQYFDGADTSAYNSILVEIDNAPGNIWQIGMPQKAIFNSAATIPNAMITDTTHFYPASNTSRFRARIINDWVFFGVLAFQWMQKLDMDSDHDGGIIEFSTDGGDSWQNAFNNPYVYNFYGWDPVNQDTLTNGEYAFSGTDTTWKNIWLCFDLSWMSLFPDTINVRYTFTSDSIDNEREGWMIDNMMAHITIIHTVDETEPGDYMTISPNPTTGRINIETQKLDKFHIIEKIELIDMAGKVVKRWGTSPTKFYIDISDQPEGSYILKVKTNIKTETFRVVHKR
ncbi:MAG: T9SS type A sorting domain-containing protein [Bacteroidales bacterium]|nr:T9SS type A sorting domain-containing protein [Bacteroidales bacterium]